MWKHINHSGLFGLAVAVLMAAACTSADGTGGKFQVDTVEDTGSPSFDVPVTAPWEADLSFGHDTAPLPNDIEEFDVDPCQAEQKAFGCPCTENADCATGYCVDSTDGYVCTQECLTECPEGWFCKGISGFGVDVVFLCIPETDKFCQPCTNDNQCSGGSCVPMGQSAHQFCVFPCDSDDACPDSYQCADYSWDENTQSVCLPPSGGCDCLAKNAGELRPCAVENDLGTCHGYETCDPAAGWVECSAVEPAEEICDGKDNDCDGLFDEDLPEAQPCENTVEGVGTCVGEATCLGPDGWACNAATPEPEACDYEDNDCDGQVDEDFIVDGAYATLHHCGSCSKDCEDSLPNALAFCDAGESPPKCKVEECLDGYYPLNEFQCIAPPDVQCTDCEVQSDCYFDQCVALEEGSYCLTDCSADPDVCPEGSTCTDMDSMSVCVPDTGTCECNEANAGAKKGCSVTNETGICFGFQTCELESGWTACDAMIPADEVCDGIDNDCDGLIDNDLPPTQPCEATNEWGTCQGVALCSGLLGWVCQAPQPAMEICDYQDNDCDGTVDEEFKDGDKYVTDSHCGTCNNACFDAIPNATGMCDDSYLLPKCVVDSCAEGYFQVSPFQCVIPPDTTCQTCAVDADCVGSLCVEIDGKKRCAKPCALPAECEGETACQPYPEKGDLCLPVSGSCECNSFTHGTKRSCSVGNDVGTCFGFETCDAVAGWSACSAPTPADEICDGKDNDCNGLVDDALPASQECQKTNAFGTCTGVSVCNGAQGWVCQATEPKAETCDYQDNDCDGAIDEDFKLDEKYHTDSHCGTCNNACAAAIPNATGTCDASYLVPKCVVDACDDGYFQVSPFQCVVPPDTTCQACAQDSDCIGSFCLTIDGVKRCARPCADAGDCADETACEAHPGVGDVCLPVTGSCECNSFTAGSKRTCSMSNDLGTCYGFQTCDAVAGWSDCDALSPSVEICDGVDNDCNGLIDDGLPATQPCSVSNGFGTCQGQATCIGSAGWVCQANTPAAEICDYQDNDCDGDTDEDFRNLAGDYNAFDHCGSCTISCAGGFPHAQAVCDDSGDTPQCVVESCDPGYFQIDDFQCIADTASLCEPCTNDDNCVFQGARCVELADGSYCSKPCAGDSDCPDGYACGEYDGDMQCLPLTNSCDCDGSNTELSKSCSATWPPTPLEGEPFTTCYGAQNCTAQGWSDCNLPDEVCDGIDNDCNGTIDDPFLVDGKYVQDANCGQCGNNCAFLQYPNASGVCDATQTVPDCVMECQLGYYDINANPGDGCECFYQGETDVPDGIDQNCDGVDGEVDNAIFVAKNGDDGNSGAIDQPMLSIQAAIDAAVAQGKRDVYVATGVYSASVVLKQGVRVYGGYASDFRVRNVLLYETVIIGSTFSPTKPGAVNAIAISGAPGTTVLAGFTIFGKNNNTPGGSSYAIYVRNSTNALTLADNTVEAGVGGVGQKGGDGVNGMPGVVGQDGGDAYGASTSNCGSSQLDLPRPGGNGAVGSCGGGTPVNGGDGGGNTCPDDYNEAPVSYENGDSGEGPDGGNGGYGGYDREVWYCYSFPGGECHQPTSGNEVGNTGQPGGTGANGNTGGGNGCSPGNADGQVVAGLWNGGAGLSGGLGANGSGGGGGGAGGGAQDGSGCSDRTQIGGAGGGGGSGGCGGTGGSAGGAGGGSFGLFLVWDTPPASAPTINDNVFYGSVGGAGGQGGIGGSGGPGGQGGAGGAENYQQAKCAAPGGNGGPGGHGGHGEGGGGGCGGASYCLFAHGQGTVSLSAYKSSNSFVPGSGGPGGSGGPSIGNPGDSGAAGATDATNL